MDAVELTDDELPRVYEPDWEMLKTTSSEGPFMEASFYLLREASHWMVIISGLQPATPLDRNRAIIRGLLVRTTKLMRLTLRELKDQESFQQLSISRGLIETFATLVYLLEDSGDGTRYDQYVWHSLVAEREVLKAIGANIARRDGEVWDIEKRMERSIKATAKAAGVEDISTLPARSRIGFPSIEERLRRLGPVAYTGYRTGSGETHGDWNDLYRNHLEYSSSDETFSVNLEPLHVRPQPPLMATLLCTMIITEFIDQVVDTKEVAEFFTPKLTELLKRTQEVDALHEQLIQRS